MLKNLFCAVVAVETTITTLTIITEPETLLRRRRGVFRERQTQTPHMFILLRSRCEKRETPPADRLDILLQRQAVKPFVHHYKTLFLIVFIAN